MSTSKESQMQTRTGRSYNTTEHDFETPVYYTSFGSVEDK